MLDFFIMVYTKDSLVTGAKPVSATLTQTKESSWSKLCAVP